MALPRTGCIAYSTLKSVPAFYNIQNFNLCSETDISKTAWVNAWHLCKQFKLERLLIEKLKFKHLNGVFGVFWFNMGFCVCKNKPYILGAIITKHANKFC